MARRVVTEDLYESLLVSFRQFPGNIAEACRMANVGRKLADRAWEYGWPHIRGGRSIKSVLAEETFKARAAMVAEAAARQAMLEKEREEARAQAVRARKEEGTMVTLARSTAVQALVMVSQCVQGGRALSAQLKKVLEAEAAKPNPEMSPAAIVAILTRVADLTSRLNTAAHLAMQMERLHLGEPTDVIGIKGDITVKEDLTLEEAELRIKAAQQALDDAKRVQMGPLEVIRGGKAD